jgi:poly-beta-1,6-N-acetyl-D-glucosamine biosynthesis protein PgaD
MKQNLIIEASDRLSWHQRLASTASTAALWGGWLWLWAPLLKAVGPLSRLAPELPVWGLAALPGGAHTLPLSIAAIAGIPSTVVAWRKLPRQRAKVESELPLAEYARYFDVCEHAVEAGRRSSVTVVHHHADGRIAHIECRAPATSA